MNRIRISEEYRARLEPFKDRLGTTPDYVIAAMAGVPYRAVSALRRELGIPKVAKKPGGDIERAVRAYLDGEPVQTIIVDYQVSAHSLYREIARRGIRLRRPRGE